MTFVSYEKMKQDENKLEASILVKCNNFAQSEFALI